MKRILLFFSFTLWTLSSCSTTPSIWGVAPTPTSAQTSPDVLYDPFLFQENPEDYPSPTAVPLADAILPDPAPSAEATYVPSQNIAPILYYAQSGDMLSAVAARFGVSENEITSNADLTGNTLLDPGVLLIIPDRITEPTTPNIQILPDSEIVFSRTAVDFDTEAYVKEQNGYLSSFRDYLGSTGSLDGHEAIQRLAVENSINPRLLLGLLEYEARWVRRQPVDLLHTEYPMGFNDYRFKGMSMQLSWAINHMSIAFYGWRAGTLTHLEFTDGSRLRLDPHLNAGTVAIQYLFSRLYTQSQWSQIINPETGFPAIYQDMFGDSWVQAELAGTQFPPSMNQPILALPFEPGIPWNFTGGPHNAWGQINPEIYGQGHSVFAAIDFGPPTKKGGCDVTDTWVTASAPGLVVRSDNGAVMVDLDGDGYEQTGWNILYMHIAKKDRIQAGTWLETNDHIGHASCEGGFSTGTHLHFVRKFNGEWVTADGPIPFILSGWRVFAGEVAYEGKLVRGDQEVIADVQGQSWSSIIREEDTGP